MASLQHPGRWKSGTFEIRRRHAEEQEDWAAYMKDLEREVGELGIAPPTSATLRMRAKRAAKKGFLASPEVTQAPRA